MPLSEAQKAAIRQQYGSDIANDVITAQEYQELIDRSNKGEKIDPGTFKKYGAGNISDIRKAYGEAERQIREKIKLRGGSSKPPSGMGITSTITRKTGERFQLTSSSTGQKVRGIEPTTFAGGFSSVYGGTGGYTYNPNASLQSKNEIKTNQDFRTGSSVLGPDFFLTNRGVVQQVPASFQSLPTKTPASSLPSTQYEVLGLPNIPSETDSRDRFFEERRQAIERLSKQGPVQEAVAGGASGLFTLSEAASRPKRTITGLSTFASRVISNPTKEFTNIITGTAQKAIDRPIFFLFETATSGQVLGVLGRPISRAAVTKVSQLEEIISPNFLKGSNIELLGGKPPLAPLSELTALENKTIPAIHVSRGLPLGTTKGKLESIITGNPQKVELVAVKEGVGGFRSKVEQFGFFRSTPNPITGNPRALLFFGGVSKATESEVSKIALPSLLPKKPIKAFIEDVKVTKTKVGPNDNILQILARQEAQPGKTFVAAENLAKKSREAQVTTPVKVSDFPRTGRSPSAGSILQLEKKEGFLFYRQSVAPTFFPDLLKRSSFFTETEKVLVYRTKTLPAGAAVLGSSNIRPVDIGRISSESLRSSRTVPATGPPVNLLKSSGSKTRSVSSRASIISSTSVYRRSTSRRRTDRIASITSKPSVFRSGGRENNSFSYTNYPSGEPTRIRDSPARLTSSPPNRERSSTRSTPSTPTYLRPLPKTSIPILSKSSRKSSPSIFSKKPTLEKGFLVGIYKKGKFVNILSSRPLVEKEAIGLGAKFVQEDIKASFKVIPTDRVARATGLKGPTEILRPGKRDPSLFVEKEKFRISTRKEKGTLRAARLSKANDLFSRKNYRGILS